MFTSLWIFEGVMEMKDHLLYVMLNVRAIWTTHKHHPVMSEALRGWPWLKISFVAKLNLNSHHVLE